MRIDLDAVGQPAVATAMEAGYGHDNAPFVVHDVEGGHETMLISV